MLNKIVYTVVLLIGACVIFVGGVVTGSAYDTFAQMHAVSMVQKESVDAMKAWTMISRLHEGEREEVIGSLNLELDNSILLLGMFLDDLPDDENRRLALITLTRIAEQREAHPHDPEVMEARDEIEAILKRARETAAKEGNQAR